LITPAEIRTRLQRLWDSGRVLRAWLGHEALFPLEIPLGRPGAGRVLEDFAGVQAWKESIEAGCRCAGGPSYRLEYTEINHRQVGRQRLPVLAVFDDAAELAAFLGKERDLARFARTGREIRARHPVLADWIAERPLEVLAQGAQWPGLLAVLDHLLAHPRPACYARELTIPGVDSKFIEGHRRILAELLDRVLPPAAIDQEVRGLARNGFERRYGLRHPEPGVRLRLLDPALAGRYGGLSDLGVPLGDFAALDPPCRRVFITENLVNGLSFPAVPESLVVFGLGYGVESLKEVPWLRARQVHYWGDIDTHGLAILSQLRGFLPEARPLLMDLATLQACRTAWVEEPAERRCATEPPNLDQAGRELYRILIEDRLAPNLRLEQERVPFARVLQALRELG
jgi:hypothetical protein